MNEINSMLKINLEKFKTHRATLLIDDERWFIVDWRRSDGDIYYYVNYIVDKKRGSLIVSGDLGDSIATWYAPATPEDIAQYIKNNVGYYIDKMECSSHKYTYETDDVIEDIKTYISDEDIAESGYGIIEFWSDVEDEINNCPGMTWSVSRCFCPSDSLIDLLSKIDGDCWEWISTCGRRISVNPYLWAAGFNMALEQLADYKQASIQMSHKEMARRIREHNRIHQKAEPRNSPIISGILEYVATIFDKLHSGEYQLVKNKKTNGGAK